MIKSLLLIAALAGQIYYEQDNGRAGIKCAGNTVLHVYAHGTKILGLIYENDVIIESDGKPGTSGLRGPAGTIIHLKVKRQSTILEFDIERVPNKNVKD